MVTETLTPAAADTDVVACDYCLKPIDGGEAVSLVVRGVALTVCGVDARYLARRPVYERVRALRYLVRTYRTAQAPAGAGDDGDDDGGPAPAAPAVRPVALALVAAGAGPAWVELSPADEAELDAFEQAACESRDPLPCDGCGKAASPAVETDAGTYCLTCGEGPAAPPSARAAARTWRFAASCRRLAAARLGRELAGARR